MGNLGYLEFTETQFQIIVVFCLLIIMFCNLFKR